MLTFDKGYLEKGTNLPTNQPTYSLLIPSVVRMFLMHQLQGKAHYDTIVEVPNIVQFCVAWYTYTHALIHILCSLIYTHTFTLTLSHTHTPHSLPGVGSSLSFPRGQPAGDPERQSSRLLHSNQCPFLLVASRGLCCICHALQAHGPHCCAGDCRCSVHYQLHHSKLHE